ncbi:hypothetical protein [Botrimarina sp.]|uniref:hypothetical protein n=1 Tax=Botrimarina sp. TaxID=2795802 RepID=UPI0032EC241F
MRLSTLLSCAVLAATASAASADPIFKITELWTGLSGPDGAADWLEVTNFGDMPGDTGTLYYDDENPTIESGGQLDSFILAPGESAVFLTDSEPADETFADSLSEFAAIWGGGIRVGLTNGGGNLGQGGDQANLLLGDGSIIASFDYSASGDVATFEDPTGDGPIALSSIGVNGAYESAAFVNENLALPPGTTITMIGSPGRVPEPTAVALAGLAMAALSLGRSRR